MGAREAARLAAAALALTLAGCLDNGGEETLQGYVEGTYRLVGPESGGRLVAVEVARGEEVAADTVLFRLDPGAEAARVAEAEARLRQAEAQLADLKAGRRDEEIRVLEAELDQARASFAAAMREFERVTLLKARNVVADAAVDTARERRDVAEARVEAAERQLAVARLPARAEEIEAAERNVAALRAALELARDQHGRRRVVAPASGIVEEIYYEPGEVVGAGQPVVSILPEGGRKIRFYVPEPRLSAVRIGGRVALGCDGCPPGLEAEIAFIATSAEFTPPVIFSKESRDKLVWRVEARPLGEAARLNVGQPVDVRLLAGAAR